MNQEKIGKYIATCRKKNKLTQEQLAEKLGVSSKSVSRWENGKTMPDVSLFQQLCKELNITINDLLSGETMNENKFDLSADRLVDYSKYIKLREKKKLVVLSVGLIILIGLFLIVLVLIFNKTFFKSYYELDYLKNISIPIPRYSYYRGTGGMEGYTTKLKTLKQPDEVNILIDGYLNTLDKIECNDKEYYYDKNKNFTIIQYRINNDGIGFVNTIYISYIEGNVCK